MHYTTESIFRYLNKTSERQDVSQIATIFRWAVLLRRFLIEMYRNLLHSCNSVFLCNSGDLSFCKKEWGMLQCRKITTWWLSQLPVQTQSFHWQFSLDTFSLQLFINTVTTVNTCFIYSNFYNHFTFNVRDCPLRTDISLAFISEILMTSMLHANISSGKTYDVMIGPTVNNLGFQLDTNI